MLGSGWPVYANAVPPPDRMSTATLGQRSYLVIARLVLPGGAEQWWPARTLRWVDGAVQITFEPAGEPVYVWLSAGDVRRTIHMPTAVDAAVDDPADLSESGQPDS